jgi:cell division protein FtsI (penicillin-binding protein 3)
MPPSGRPAQHDAAGRTRERTRVVCCLGLVLIALGLLAGRLIRLQALEAAPGVARLEEGMGGSVRLRARRGTIVDREGRPLAMSVRRYGCALDPGIIPDLETALRALDGALNLTTAERAAVRRRIWLFAESGRELRFVWVRRELSDPEAEAVSRLDLPGLILAPSWRRFYPQGATACHVVGFTSRDGEGLEGLERTREERLTARPGRLRVERDARRRAILLQEELVEPRREGRRLVLALDSYLQHLAEETVGGVVERYRPERVTAVAMDPYTGDVLALVNHPAYDLNQASAVAPGQRLNACLAAVYEPGSVFKPFILAAALESGTAHPGTRVYCENGAWDLGYRVLHDTHPYGWLTAAQVVVKSSNIGIAKVAAPLGPERLHAYLRGFGFGRETGVELPGELPGLLRPVAAWNPRFSMTSIPMGQEVAVTSLQLATAFSALVNGGLVVQPRVVRAVTDERGEVVEEVPVTPLRRVISAETSRTMRRVLARVVTEGTGRRVRMAAYAAGGKTGTAQMAGPAGGYEEGAYVGTFCGFAPAEAPRLLVLVSVWRPEGAYYGGVVAAPAVKRILREGLLYLQVPPRVPLSQLTMR